VCELCVGGRRDRGVSPFCVDRVVVPFPGVWCGGLRVHAKPAPHEGSPRGCAVAASMAADIEAVDYDAPRESPWGGATR